MADVKYIDKSKRVFARSEGGELLCIGKWEDEDESHVFIKPLFGGLTMVLSKENTRFSN